MQGWNRNVDSEWVSMCQQTVLLIKINTLNLRTPICTVACNKFPCIITVTFLTPRSNEWTENFCSFREGLIGMGSEISLTLLFLSNWTKRASFQNCIWGRLKFHQYYLVWDVSLRDELQYVKPQVWIDQIWSKYLQDLLFGRYYFCIDWYLSWILSVEFDDDWVHQVHLDLW